MYGRFKNAVATIFVLGIVLSHANGGKFPDMTIMKGPDCTGRSESEFYNHNVARLIDTLVDQTQRGYRNEKNDRAFNHSMPNRNPGSPTGGATCYEDLDQVLQARKKILSVEEKQVGSLPSLPGISFCWYCLLTAKDKIYAGCHKPITANITLQDCSMWFRMIH